MSIENLYLNLFDIFILLHEAGGQKAIVEEQAEEYVALIMEDHQGTWILKNLIIRFIFFINFILFSILS